MKQSLLVLFFVLSAVVLRAQNTSRPEFAVSPNPATEHITIDDHQDMVGQIVVFNLLGKRLKTFEATKGSQYYIGDLVKGVYLVQLVDRQKQIINTQKIQKR